MKKSDINVLIVDDDKAIGKTLSEAIVRAGYKPLWASRASEALNMVSLTNVQVAVIDCMLPVKNGVVLAEELRKTRFENGSIVLMSGVFRDKSFEADALKRTGAITYLQKPFGPADLMAALKPALDALVDTSQKWSLQSVLTKKIESVRDRVKIVENLEEIRGVEAAFALSILMEAKISGFLNLVTATGDIFGVVLQNGKVASVDSDDAEEMAIKFLVDTGYLANDDWQEFSVASESKVRLQKLLQAGYISPHAAFQARRDQIVTDFKRILKADKLNVSFVPDSGTDAKAEGVDMIDLFSELSEALDSLLPLDYLKEFFQAMLPSTFRTLNVAGDHAIWKLPMVGRVKGIVRSLDGLTTLQQTIEKNPTEEISILKAIYLMVIFGQALFTDREAIKAFEAEAARRQKLFDAIATKNPYEIFEYFGAKPGAKVKEVETIFKEFVRSNHPDRLPPDALQSLKDITQRLFQLVSGAYDTLSNEEKRAAYEVQRQSQEAERELRADAMTNEALELIRRGSYHKAEEKLDEAAELASNNFILYLKIWAKLKQPTKLSKAELAEWQKKLDLIPNSDRNTPYYHMALGLLRVGNGDALAINSFEKAISIDGNFLEARREISAMRPVKETNSSPDLLTGDITQIVSQIFKRKAK